MDEHVRAVDRPEIRIFRKLRSRQEEVTKVLSKHLEEMIYDDIFGINIRFRDGEYDLTKAEETAIRDYFDEIIRKVEKLGYAEVDEFKDFIGIIEVLEKADHGKAILLCQYVYDKVLHMK